jgi:hypothetical protein
LGGCERVVDEDKKRLCGWVMVRKGEWVRMRVRVGVRMRWLRVRVIEMQKIRARVGRRG